MNSSREIPLNVQVLLNECIESVSDLDILTSLSKSGGKTAKFVSGELRAHPVSTERNLKRLVNCNLLKESEGLYSIADEAQSKLTPLLEIYQARPVSVIAFLYERPTDLESFANAFKWKKD